jgi:hypothetical protein
MLLVALATWLPACTGASSEGSDDAASAESGAGDDAAVDDGGADVLSAYCIEAGDRGDGSRFSDLYRDFFGPTGLASCSAQSICHVPGGNGALISGGYVCTPDQNGCWSSMTSTIVPSGGTSTPEGTTLYKALRKAPPLTGSGPMPRNSSFAFCPGDLQRIADWISSGAANN